VVIVTKDVSTSYLASLIEGAIHRDADKVGDISLEKTLKNNKLRNKKQFLVY